MPRIARSEIADRMSTTNPRLVVINSSTGVNRYHQMMRIRPTLLARIQSLTVGPFYLIAEHALERLCDDLEAMEPGTLRSINAFHMDPSVEDKELMDNVPSRRQRTAKGAAKFSPVAVAAAAALSKAESQQNDVSDFKLDHTTAALREFTNK